MAETKQANQGAVASIADTDLVMVVAPGGGYHPISFADLMKAVRSGIQIGGRNYAVMNTAILQNASLDGYTLKQVVADTRSFSLNVTVFDSSGNQTALYNKSSITDGRYKFTVNVPEGTAHLYLKHNGQSKDFGAKFVFPYSGQFVIGVTIKASSSLYELTDLMIERGNVSTDWTPAPEDIVSGAWGGE